MQLVCVREVLAKFDAIPHHLDLLKMGVLGVLVPVSNAKHNHVSLTFADEPAPMHDLADVLNLKFRQMIEDIKAAAALPCSEVEIYRGNSKEASKVLPTGFKATAVITSPPYPNRFSYARETDHISSISISSRMPRRSVSLRPMPSVAPGARQPRYLRPG